MVVAFGRAGEGAVGSRARQTGAGEHPLGATLTGGGAATAAVRGVEGGRRPTDKR